MPVIKFSMTVYNIISKYNLWVLVKYGIIGIGAASTHALVALLFFHMIGTNATLANFAGFVAGAIISYLGSYYFTFNSNHPHKKTLPRFVIVWLVGIFINVGLFKTLIIAFNIPFFINVFIAIVLTPIAQFLMLNFWAFKKT